MKRQTGLLVIAGIAIFVVYDCVALYLWGTAGTISVGTWELSLTHPIIPFACGVLCGHLFWRMQLPSKETNMTADQTARLKSAIAIKDAGTVQTIVDEVLDGMIAALAGRPFLALILTTAKGLIDAYLQAHGL